MPRASSGSNAIVPLASSGPTASRIAATCARPARPASEASSRRLSTAAKSGEAMSPCRRSAPVAVVRHHAHGRHGQVIAQRQVALARCRLVAALEDLEDQLLAFVAVFARQGLEPLERRRVQRQETMALEHGLRRLQDVPAEQQLLGQEVAGAGGRREVYFRHEASPLGRGLRPVGITDTYGGTPPLWEIPQAIPPCTSPSG